MNILNNFPYGECEITIYNYIATILMNYTERHGKMLAVRFDVRYPAGYPEVMNNQHISQCMAKVVQKYKRQGLDPYYCWAREWNNGFHPHYHCFLLLNGNKVEGYNHVFRNVETFWGNTIGANVTGCIDHCTTNRNGNQHQNGIMVRRCDADYSERFNDAHRQMNYLAKAEGKVKYNDDVRNFGMSRIPH